MCYNTFKYFTCRHITDDYIELCPIRQTVGVCDSFGVAPHYAGTNCENCKNLGIRSEQTIWKRWDISEKQWLKDIIKSKSYRPEWLKFKWTANEMAATLRKMDRIAKKSQDIQDGNSKRFTSTELAERMLGVNTGEIYSQKEILKYSSRSSNRERQYYNLTSKSVHSSKSNQLLQQRLREDQIIENILSSTISK